MRVGVALRGLRRWKSGVFLPCRPVRVAAGGHRSAPQSVTACSSTHSTVSMPAASECCELPQLRDMGHNDGTTCRQCEDCLVSQYLAILRIRTSLRPFLVPAQNRGPVLGSGFAISDQQRHFQRILSRAITRCRESCDWAASERVADDGSGAPEGPGCGSADNGGVGEQGGSGWRLQAPADILFVIALFPSCICRGCFWFAVKAPRI
ncbi:hypothetical protein SKAU_G00028010 [Synaphobranchus kaupii]|uniref:Uncharacterized protein n=1 Tax=Synaphobranchus kaupii TaxID=118154 RepID=A0A9Q1GEC5_SYNKA|nr:hypothetical protein SKAU_G00028010 [Synaphobranchus kaupii]